MDLAFHSRVVRKLFHNYKHQLHNIMKYQLTLQKELNLKYQQEKSLKLQIQKLEDDIKNMQRVAEEPKKVVSQFNFADEDEQKEKKLAEMRKNHDKLKADAKLDEPHEKVDFKTMEDVKAFLNKDFKFEDLSKAREQLMLLYTHLEKERQKIQDFDPNSENYQFAMRQARADAAGLKRQGISESGTQTEGQFILDEGKKDDPILLAKLANYESEINDLKSELSALQVKLTETEDAKNHQESLYNDQVKKTEMSELENEEFRKDNAKLASEVEKLKASLKEKEHELTNANARIAALEEEAKNWHISHDAMKDGANNDKADLHKKIQELEAANQAVHEELEELKKKYQDMLKGGDSADSHIKKFIAKLETDLADAKKNLDKYK